jgi:hypothetical protein
LSHFTQKDSAEIDGAQIKASLTAILEGSIKKGIQVWPFQETFSTIGEQIET